MIFLKYVFVFVFSPTTGLDISCKLETIFMKCQNLFCGKNKKHIISLSSANFTQGVVKEST